MAGRFTRQIDERVWDSIEQEIKALDSLRDLLLISRHGESEAFADVKRARGCVDKEVAAFARDASV